MTIQALGEELSLDDTRIKKLKYFAYQTDKFLLDSGPIQAWRNMYQTLLNAEAVGKHLMNLADAEMKSFLSLMYKNGFPFVVSLNVQITTTDGHQHKWPDCLTTCLGGS